MAEVEPVVKAEITTKESKYEGKSRLKQEPDTPGKIMVSGIPKQKEYKESDLENEFAPYGRITEGKCNEDIYYEIRHVLD